MAAHDWKAGHYVHSSPGSEGIWDQRAVCRKCGTEAILVGQSPTNAIEQSLYEGRVLPKRDKERVVALREVERIPEDCDQMIVDEMHSR